ncbi:LysR family transcriptional regulator [Pontivivens insulae]|uniref:HTH-type transcriptional regulator PgrR n=1 Tax=Pontivivens insulae TaxID=1639689 RepID=A0A2R8A8V8_9RHOB|nr:LysR family transcriptional regulator [Pontivivens insulae]RED18758.1 LysR family transcriptional regulator [Pontivivens insulae]SPF28656.1 HTH-type transcriptional regulator PgrR [Pontivivens insulae]
MDRLDWAYVESFLAVAETGSLSAAARLTGISQPTLGRHVREFEESVGAELFMRHARGLDLSAAGTQLMPDAQAMRDAMQRMRLTAAGQAEAPGGTVRITASAYLSSFRLPQVIADLRQKHPEIAIELVPSDSTANLLFREADIAVRMYRPTQPDVITRHVADLPLGLFAAYSYLERRGVPVDLQTFGSHDLIGYDSSTLILDAMAEMGLDFTREDFVVRCDDQVANWQMVRAGCGIGVGQLDAGRADPLLRQVLPDLMIRPLPVWLTAPRALRTNPNIRAVYDHLAVAFA